MRDALAFERLEAIHAQIGGLLAKLDTSTSNDARDQPASSWRNDGAVVVVPGRGQLDDLAALMAVQVLRAVGFGARVEANLILGASATLPPTVHETRLCCLSIVEDGSTSSATRYALKRVRRIMPDTTVAVCLWQARSDSPLLAHLRAHGADEHLVVSIGELIALARVLASRDKRLTRANADA